MEMEERNENRSGSTFCVHNKLKDAVWVASYYKWRVFWGDGKRYHQPVQIDVAGRISIPELPIRTDRTRILVIALHEDELKEKLSHKGLQRLTVCSISSNIFIEYKTSERVKFQGYSTLRYQQRKLNRRLSFSKPQAPLEEASPGRIRSRMRRAITPVLGDSTSSQSLYSVESLSNSEVFRREHLCTKEQEFLEKRHPITKSAIERFLGMEEGSLEDDLVPRIAFCGSGGGARAMLHTVGVLQGLSDCGVEECLTYVGGLSGSTWALSVWQALHLSTDGLADNIRTKLEEGNMIRITPPMLVEFKEIVLSKLSYGDSKFNIITDGYAAMIAVYLLKDTQPNGGQMTLTHLGNNANLAEGDYPMPIFVCATQEPDDDFEWFEFTPYTVGCAQYDCFIDTNLFGRKFIEGELKYPEEDPLETKLACLLATFACAYCAPLRMVADEFYEGFQHQPRGLFSETVYGTRRSVSDVLLRLKLSEDHALEPPLYRNFMYGIHRSPLRKIRYIPLVDAGMSFNLPFPPLLEPLRNVDIIIAANSSKTPGIADNHSLRGIANYAEKRKLKFPHIDYDLEQADELICDRPFSVFSDVNEDPTCPTIIYLPLCGNKAFSEDFCPQEKAKDGYCQTFNFDIKPHEFDELTGLAMFNTTQAADSIRNAILNKIEQKKRLSVSP